MIIYFIIGFFLGLILYETFVFCSIKTAAKEMKKNFKDVDVIFKEKWDIVPEIIKIAKKNTSNKKVLEEIILLRNTKYENMNNDKKINTDREISRRISLISSNGTLEELENKFFAKQEELDELVEVYAKKYHKYLRLLENHRGNIILKIFKF